MKKARSYYSAAVAHPEIPGAFICSVGIPGQMPEWLMDRGSRKIFASSQEAEIAGYRLIVTRLNRSTGEQTPVMKRPHVLRPAPPSRAGFVEKAEAERVFSRFRKKVDGE